MNSSELRRISNWLIDGTWAAQEPAVGIADFCERLVAAGLPLWRFGIFIRTLHPEVFGRNFIWRQGEGVEIGTVDFEVLETPQFARSPLRIVFEQGIEVRGRAGDPDSKRFPFLEDMHAEGATDYIAVPVPFLDGSVHATSWITQQPGGFSDDDLAAIRTVIAPLARISEIISQRRTAEMLLDTYVGNRAGARVLGGQIRRGHHDTMQAAIWLSDLRGFTALSDRLPPETVVQILNHYFDCQVTAIRDHGGEVLKFMGDGLLAVFPIDEYVGDAAHVCARVLEATRESRASVEALAFPIGDVVERFRFGVALHVGNILYGNIGGGNRLDFTCIGPAVNLAARLEKITGRLGRTVVASEGFANVCQYDWQKLGEFPIAGFSKAQRVYGLAEEAPAVIA
ncbi:adenylate/guanylate cyclase domain-containing protein [Bradyrhizobium sp. CCBAU 51765]|uniref:adenylate/guanylate cyclase domain-containing protein n=1 Tax=Bradyrhizobium sp. CCBAU 51765 TaxID=1325102 RepID=UPI0018897DC3|nr:adenylate/guanylate cyclase domain-containing protein [Bradyrhizobium sp. CCBAU 51765]QOZ11273.1 adenylate/guanylate cyclase domain-containing protein [Bradyrhizobium sp. CCBAU 51765]